VPQTAHEPLHHAIRATAGSRIEAALAGELRLSLARRPPVYDGPALVAEHAALLDNLEHGTGRKSYARTSTLDATLLTAMERASHQPGRPRRPRTR
jgi:hypothetical protein